MVFAILYLVGLRYAMFLEYECMDREAYNCESLLEIAVRKLGFVRAFACIR